MSKKRREKHQSKEDRRVAGLHTRRLCQHKWPLLQFCQEYHALFIDMTIDAMGDHYIGYGNAD